MPVRNSFIKQPFTEPVTEDENRIDWDRKNQKKKRATDEILVLDEDSLHLVDEKEQVPAGKEKARRGKKDKRDKRRHLVMDETSGQVVVKRRRKRHQSAAWSDDYYE